MLTHLERSLLEFEAAHLRHTAAKQEGIRQHGFASSPTAYYTMLRAVLANPEAVEAFPQLAAWHKRAADARAGTKERRRIERMESASQRVRNELAS
ncbi:DUF3263 domain-containing protein [Pseudoclavibacter sp. AY1H1]|uniref:DUF3263 domain-containing protein n=1 Tax=Pseudoclavibacter sp. AY1H1 TaxID=2080584 RepID=UPI000CE91368|nr:DUF3263 domain-containing protein [Pseudoclavibacter sp. AY1H1]PPF39996.1 hypothetical protein C5E05_01925 [Pseudoclavibacter sp. AY1H1]